tara:strand:- start:91 stop:666 length:576 start_codon:yes stop_codon:yes gene_type:complete
MNPVDKFKNWYDEEVEVSSVRIPSACCLTSIGLDGYPNSRIVSLKEIVANSFVVTGPLNSRKGVELLNNSKSSLTFWWTKTERQIRIQGDAVQIDNQLAERYFAERSLESQLVSKLSSQGSEIENLSELKDIFEKKISGSNNDKIERPIEWAGFYIKPKRIEFMQFQENRFHIRKLYLLKNGSWNKKILQP